MGWKSTVKRALFRLAYYSGLELLLARLVPANAAAIVMFHGVCDDSRLPPEVDFHLTSEAFERHLRMLKRRYPVVPLSRLLDRLERGERLHKEIVLTFDDGYRNNLTVAHPILQRHALPYAVYLATAYIGRDEWLPLNQVYAQWHFGKIGDDQMRQLRKQLRSQPSSRAPEILKSLTSSLTPAERELSQSSFAMLSWQEVRDLAAQGVEFGSHTHTHCNMAVESPAQQVEQLNTAIECMASGTGTRPATFAYPYGRPENWSQETRANVMAAGHRCAILATGGLVRPGDDLFALRRTSYSPETWYFACDLLSLFIRNYLHR